MQVYEISWWWVSVIICAFIIFPLSKIRVTRKISINMMEFMWLIFAVHFVVYGGKITYEHFGLVITIISLLFALAGAGVLAMIASVFSGDWAVAGELLASGIACITLGIWSKFTLVRWALDQPNPDAEDSSIQNSN